MPITNPCCALRRVVDAFRSQAEFARELNVSPQAITKWLKAGVVPPKKVIAVERAYRARTGKTDITRCDLSPDLYPREGNHIAA